MRSTPRPRWRSRWTDGFERRVVETAYIAGGDVPRLSEKEIETRHSPQNFKVKVLTGKTQDSTLKTYLAVT